MWILYAVISALFAGMVAVFAKLGLKNIDSTLATTVRTLNPVQGSYISGINKK